METSRQPRVLLIDWLGRGGIAHTSEAWRRSLLAAGCEVVIATRAGRELGGDIVVSESPRVGVPGRVLTHRRLVGEIIRDVVERPPDFVVIQNYMLPTLELSVFKAARRAGATVALVVHDGVPHSFRSGSGVGLRRLIGSADVVITHSEYVAQQVRERVRSSMAVEITPLPCPVGLAELSTSAPMLAFDPRPTVIQFGILRRSYKNAGLGLAVEALLHTRWRFVAAGVGARSVHGEAFDEFLPADRLVGLVASADVALLPYLRASQSAAVLLSQVLGTVPVASAVGGIPEQICSGVDGVLVPPAASPDTWAAALAVLEDSDVRAQMALAARARVRLAHESFQRSVSDLVGIGR